MNDRPPPQLSELPDLAVLDVLPVPVSIRRYDGHQVLGNRAYWEMMGREPDPDLDVLDFTHPEDRALTREYHRRLQSGLIDSVDVEKRLLRSDGSILWVRLRAQQATTAEGPVLVGVFEDIGVARRHRLQLAEERDRATAVAARTATFLAEAAHDLRSPLQGLLGLTELLSSTPDDPDLSIQLEESTRSLLALVDDVLDISRLHATEQRPRFGPVEIEPLVTELLTAFRHSSSSQHLTLAKTVDASVPDPVIVDPVRLRRVLRNLIDNAIDHTDEGTVHVTVTTDDQELIIHVDDTGIGMSPAEVEVVFERFSRGSSAPSREGTGLGLAIASDLVGVMGGSLEVASELGAGSTFTVRLPLRVPEPLVTVPASGTDDPPTPGYRVLLVEDDRLNSRIISTQLRRLGHEVVQAMQAEEALAILEQTSVDVVLMDGRLPGMDGWEAARVLRQRKARRPDGRPLGIILVSASVLPSDQSDPGFDEQLVKPVTGSELDQAIRRVATGSERVIDTGHLELLVSDLGDRFLVVEVVRSFIEQMPARLEPLGHDDTDLAGHVHALASAAMSIGASELGSTAHEQELAIRSGQAADIERIARSADRASRALESWIQANTEPD